MIQDDHAEDRVLARLREAAATLRALPPERVHGFKSQMPDVLQRLEDMVSPADHFPAQSGSGSFVEEFDRLRQARVRSWDRPRPPSPEEIARMDEALRWMRFPPAPRQRICLWGYVEGKSFRRIGRDVGASHTLARMEAMKGLDAIVRALWWMDFAMLRAAG